jgi:hypothetical protein
MRAHVGADVVSGLVDHCSITSAGLCSEQVSRRRTDDATLADGAVSAERRVVVPTDDDQGYALRETRATHALNMARGTAASPP